MTSDRRSVERLRDSLRGCKPQTRALLVAEFERGMLRGGAGRPARERAAPSPGSAQLPRRGSHCGRIDAVMM